MRKICTIVLLLSAICASAQITIWGKTRGLINDPTATEQLRDTFYSSVIAQYDYDEIDSVTFSTIEIKEPQGTPNAITLKIKFEVPVCDGYEVRFVGDHADNYWDIATAPAFTSIGEGWYQIILRANASGTITGRPIMANASDADWYHDWSRDVKDIIGVEGLESGMIDASGYGEINLTFSAQDIQNGAVVSLRSAAWYVYPCAPKETYTVTLLAPPFCGKSYDLEVVGSFENWGDTPVKMTKAADGRYTATIQAKPKDTYKIRGISDEPGNPWKVELKYLESGKWEGVPNYTCDTDKNPVIDHSDSSKYKWSVCIE